MLQSQICVPWVQLQGSVPLLRSEEGSNHPPSPVPEEKQKPFLTLPDNKATVIALSQGQAKDPKSWPEEAAQKHTRENHGGPVTPQTPADPSSL